MGCPEGELPGENIRPSDSGERPPELDLDEAVSGEDEPSRLACAFQAGDRTVLAALHRTLRPLMASVLSYYRDRPGMLPAGLEGGDLAQESWLIVADLAGQWHPKIGSFGAYFRVCFPWALARYIRLNSPSRRVGSSGRRSSCMGVLWPAPGRLSTGPVPLALPDPQGRLAHLGCRVHPGGYPAGFAPLVWTCRAGQSRGNGRAAE